MIRASLCTLLLLSCANGWADWSKVSTPDSNLHFYDESRVYVNSNEVTYWRRVEYHIPRGKKPPAARSAMFRERLNCAQNTLVALGYLSFSADGKLLENRYTPEAEPQLVLPGTVAEQFQRLLCKPLEAVPPRKSGSERSAGEALQGAYDALAQRVKVLEERLVHLEQAAMPAGTPPPPSPLPAAPRSGPADDPPQ